MNLYYKIPVSFGKLISGEKHPQTDINQSIEDFIELIILTIFGEYRGDPSFGCKIWEDEFDITPLETKWQMEIKKSIYESIKAHEVRLEDVQIDVHLDETSHMKKKIGITVSGIIKLTGETFWYQKAVYLCPKSID
jgi:phage baseplate assembly protein W